MAPPYNYGPKRRSSHPMAVEKRQRIIVTIMLVIGGAIVGFLIFLSIYYKA